MGVSEDLDGVLARVAEGSPEAFRRLYSETVSDIWQRVQCPPRDTVDPAGIRDPEARVIDFYLRVWREAGLYHPEEDARAWLERLADEMLPRGRDMLPKDPEVPPQILHRLESHIAPRRHPLWQQVLPYLVGAVMAGLLVWGVQSAGMLSPSVQ